MRQNPERLAWRVLIASFAAFLVLCTGTAYLVRWYIFESHVSLDVDLAVARGTVRMTAPNTQENIAVTDRRENLEPGVGIKTDASQAVLTFSDPHSGIEVASIVLLNDSEMSLVRASAPRFHLNKDQYEIELYSQSGRCEALMLATNRRPASLVIRSPQAETSITEQGHYIVDITEERTRVTTVSGHAVVTSRTSGNDVELFDEQRTIVERTGDPLILLSSEVSLVENADFEEGLNGGWVYYEDGEAPLGLARTGVVEGRTVLTFDRSQSNWPNLRLDHGETGLRQFINADVRGHNYLEIRATFYVEEQSLSTCGTLGSECPMMIRISYTDVLGVEREFIQGFYAYFDPALDYPLSCDTCRGEHERINLNSWYTYRSGNLLTILPAEQEPAFIRQVRFYASGHAYKVHVAEVNLLAAP